MYHSIDLVDEPDKIKKSMIKNVDLKYYTQYL